MRSIIAWPCREPITAPLVRERTMTPKIRGFRNILQLILAALAFVGPCNACTIFAQTISVGSDFQIRVLDRGRPVEGLRFVVGGVRAVTNRDGIAAFRHIAPGSYSVHAPLDSGVARDFVLEIKHEAPGNVIVPFEWPTSPVVVRSLSGRLYLPAYETQASTSLVLLDGLTGATIGSTVTNPHGEFTFPYAEPGIYFLSVKPQGGLISVVLDSAATAERINIDLGWSSCGLAYTDRNKCHSGDLHIEQLCGQVSD